MITYKDIDQFIFRVRPACPVVDFTQLNYYTSVGQLYSSKGKCGGLYKVGKSITLNSTSGKKEAFAFFLHELGHHLVWLEFGTELCSTFSEYEHEVFADMWALEMAKELNFDYSRWLGRNAMAISKKYSREYK
jgi:hypothetical protein